MHQARVSIALVLFVAPFAPPSRAQCPTAATSFHAPGFDNYVRALAVFDDGSGAALYAGGAFKYVDGLNLPYLARWDGSAWSAVSGAPNWDVFALQVFDDGSGPALYVGGAFSSIGGVSALGIARWNGTSWSSVGGSITDTSGGSGVRAMAVHDDGSGAALYVVGSFTTMGGVICNGISKWNGSVWSYLLGGIGSAGQVLASYDDGNGAELYVGGYLDHAGPTPVNKIARWDGLAWSALGSGTSSPVGSMSVFDDGSGPKLYVGGSFTSAGGVPVEGVAAWDGSSWSSVGGISTVSNGGVAVLEVFDDGSGPKLYAVGRFPQVGGPMSGDLSLAHWDGVSWTLAAGGIGPEWSVVLDLQTFNDGGGDALFVGGGFEFAANVVASSIARYRAGTWTALSESDGLAGYEIRALTTHASLGGGPALYAGGDFLGAGQVKASCVARWDGASWSNLGSGLANTPTQPVANALLVHDDGSGDALYVGGQFTTAGGVNAPHFAKWDGASWSATTAGFDKPVHALAEWDDGSGSALYVGGEFSTAGGSSVGRIAKWDGSSWTALGLGVSGNTTFSFDSCHVFAMVPFDDGSGPALFVGGNFNKAGGQTALNLAKWNGASWSKVGMSGPIQAVRALAVFDDGSGPALYAGGHFFEIDGQPTGRFAKWNGVAWSTLGYISSGAVYATLAHDDGTGSSLHIGGTLGVARWGGTAWLPLGTGASGQVNALARFDDGAQPWPSLFVGGRFTTFDGHDSQLIARWSNPCACQGTSYCTAGTTAHGCVASIASTGSASRSQASGFDVTVSSVEGHKQGLVFFGLNPNATHWGTGSSWLCVASPSFRTPAQASGGNVDACDGQLVLDFNAWMQSHPLDAPASGSTVYVQGWFRDPPSPKGTSLSNALRFLVCP